MPLNTVEELVADIRAGKMVILMDDEDRENEGDLVIAATRCSRRRHQLYDHPCPWFGGA